MTDEMLALARENQRRAGVDNAEFLRGEIENIPLPADAWRLPTSSCAAKSPPPFDTAWNFGWAASRAR